MITLVDAETEFAKTMTAKGDTTHSGWKCCREERSGILRRLMCLFRVESDGDMR